MTLNVNNTQYEVFRAFIGSLDYAKIVEEKSVQCSKEKGSPKKRGDGA